MSQNKSQSQKEYNHDPGEAARILLMKDLKDEELKKQNQIIQSLQFFSPDDEEEEGKNPYLPLLTQEKLSFTIIALSKDEYALSKVLEAIRIYKNLLRRPEPHLRSIRAMGFKLADTIDWAAGICGVKHSKEITETMNALRQGVGILKNSTIESPEYKKTWKEIGSMIMETVKKSVPKEDSKDNENENQVK